MTCGLEHPTLENRAAPLQTQLMLQAIAQAWVEEMGEVAAINQTMVEAAHRALAVREKFLRKMDAWNLKLCAKKLAFFELVDRYISDVSIPIAEFDAFVKGDEYMLIQSLHLPSTRRPGGEQPLDGLGLKTFIDNMPVYVEVFEDRPNQMALSVNLDKRGSSLKQIRPIMAAAKAIQALMSRDALHQLELCNKERHCSSINQWWYALFQWRKANSEAGLTLEPIPAVWDCGSVPICVRA
jgi:hypothetical protein